MEKRTTALMLEGVDVGEYDIIGKDIAYYSTESLLKWGGGPRASDFTQESGQVFVRSMSLSGQGPPQHGYHGEMDGGSPSQVYAAAPWGSRLIMLTSYGPCYADIPLIDATISITIRGSVLASIGDGTQELPFH